MQILQQELLNGRTEIFYNKYDYSYNITEDEAWELALQKFNACVNIKYRLDSSDKLKETSTTTYKSSYWSMVVYYYEYMMFKTAVFESQGVEYDLTTGRVSEMEFKFYGKFAD